MTSTTKTTSTKRITDEVFEEVERELAAERAENVVEVASAVEPKGVSIERLAERVLPYIWTSVAGVWVAAITIMNTMIPVLQCIAAGIVTAGVLSATVFAFRSRKSRVSVSEVI